MNNFEANDAAFTMMKEGADGVDFSNRYNSLEPTEQKQVFSEMQDLKSSQDTMKLFGNVELVDNNNDGILDNATLKGKNGSEQNIYAPEFQEDLFKNKTSNERNKYEDTIITINRPEMNDDLLKANPGNEPMERATDFNSEQNDQFEPLSRRDVLRDPYLRKADRMLRRASMGHDIHGQYSRHANDPNFLEAMKAVQASNPEYSNVKLVDQNNDGMLDDARALVHDRRSNQVAEVDVYKTPQDRQEERVRQQADRALRRGGEIVVDEVFRGMRRGNGSGRGTTERIYDRTKRESSNGVQNILRDILRGR